MNGSDNDSQSTNLSTPVIGDSNGLSGGYRAKLLKNLKKTQRGEKESQETKERLKSMISYVYGNWDEIMAATHRGQNW